MTRPSDLPPSRREFFRGVLRAAALAALAGGSAALLLGRRRSGAAECVNDYSCDTCAIRSRCSLPAAREPRDPGNGHEQQRPGR